MTRTPRLSFCMDHPQATMWSSHWQYSRQWYSFLFSALQGPLHLRSKAKTFLPSETSLYCAVKIFFFIRVFIANSWTAVSYINVFSATFAISISTFTVLPSLLGIVDADSYISKPVFSTVPTAF